MPRHPKEFKGKEMIPYSPIELLNLDILHFTIHDR